MGFRAECPGVWLGYGSVDGVIAGCDCGVVGFGWSEPLFVSPMPPEIVSQLTRHAFDTYRAGPTPLGAHLLRIPAVEVPAHRNDIGLGWGKLIKGGIDARLIPGKHLNIFGRENVDALIEHLIQHLARTSATPS